MEKRIRKESEWSDYLYKKVVHSKICHQSLGVGKKKKRCTERARSWRTPLRWREAAKCLKQSVMHVQKVGSVCIS